MLFCRIFMLIILTPIILGIVGCGFSEEEYFLNPFFFPEGITTMEYEGRFILPSTRTVEQNTNLNLNLLECLNMVSFGL